MRGILLGLAVLVAVASAQYFHPQDITFPPSTCPPCECDEEVTSTTTTTTPRPTTTRPCDTPPTSPPRLCPPCVMNKCTPNACDMAVNVAFPGDCSKFCKCVHTGAEEFDCPSGLHFNEALQVCDWPQTSGCTLPGTYLGGCEGEAP